MASRTEALVQRLSRCYLQIKLWKIHCRMHLCFLFGARTRELKLRLSSSYIFPPWQFPAGITLQRSKRFCCTLGWSINGKLFQFDKRPFIGDHWQGLGGTSHLSLSCEDLRRFYIRNTWSPAEVLTGGAVTKRLQFGIYNFPQLHFEERIRE